MEINHEAILKNFMIEGKEILDQMEHGLVVLENQPGDEETLQFIFRGAHTLKGNALAFGFSGMAEFAHGLEDLLDPLREHEMSATPELITLLLQAADVLRELLSSVESGNDGLTQTQRACLERMKASASWSGQSAGVEAVGSDSPGPAAGDPIPARQEQTRTLRVDIDKVDRMLMLAGEIAIKRGHLRQMVEQVEGRMAEELLEVHREADHLFMELQEQVMKLRMVPVDPMFRQHIRTVRDLARRSGKRVRLELEGGEVEVDTTVIEHLRAPLTHMIRNAVDHGLETPDARTAKGKDPCGQITLRAFHDAGNIVIQVADDGAGINRERVLDRARTRGLLSDPANVVEKELYQLIFEPGFSTADEVTDLSGRGVGMDVVRRNIEALRGSVEVESTPDCGTTITIRLPLTLAIIEGFGVASGGEIYVIPLDAVLECGELPPGQDDGKGVGVVNLRGEPLPYVRLGQLFGLQDRSARQSIVVIQHEGRKIGIAVDDLRGESQVVIKPLNRLFQNCPGISGSAIVGNGRVALILDVPSLIKEVTRRELQAVA